MIIAGAMTAAISLVILKPSELTNRSQKRMESVMDFNQFSTQVYSILSEKSACENTVPPGTLVNGGVVNEIVDANGNVLYQGGEEYFNGNLRNITMNLEAGVDSNTNAIIPPVNLKITAEVKNGVNYSTRSKSFLLNAQIADANDASIASITTCYTDENNLLATFCTNSGGTWDPQTSRCRLEGPPGLKKTCLSTPPASASRPSVATATCNAGSYLRGFHFRTSENETENMMINVTHNAIQGSRPDEGSDITVRGRCCNLETTAGTPVVIDQCVPSSLRTGGRTAPASVCPPGKLQYGFYFRTTVNEVENMHVEASLDTVAASRPNEGSSISYRANCCTMREDPNVVATPRVAKAKNCFWTPSKTGIRGQSQARAVCPSEYHQAGFRFTTSVHTSENMLVEVTSASGRDYMWANRPNAGNVINYALLCCQYEFH